MWRHNRVAGVEHTSKRRIFAAVFVALLCTATARAVLLPWLQHAVTGTAIEAALFRAMKLPGVQVLFPRPPTESMKELDKLVAATPDDAALLSLRAHQEESALDFPAAERDWKAFATKAPDHGAAELELAAYYGRRLAVRDQFNTLLATAALSATRDDAFTAPAAQRSWRAFEEALNLAEDQSFDEPTVEGLWQQWIVRYPQQSTVYARAFAWELKHSRGAEAQATLGRFKTAFPADNVFAVKATALLALDDGGAEAQQRALAVYDKSFSPLWPQELLNSYFDLLAATHNTHRFLGDAESRLARDPDDLDAASRLFLYDRHSSHPEAGLAVLNNYRQSKEQRDPSGKNWTAGELYTLEQLTAAAQAYPDAARYAFALYHLSGALPNGRAAREAGLAQMIGLLLTAPEQPIALGAGNLSMYRDIGTLDQGPGFWNGVLSLWLNDQDVASQFAAQEAKAQPYFHRAEAAALLKLMDTKAPERAGFHAQLIQAYAGYGEDAAVLQSGESFLRDFPTSSSRVEVALIMADADARANNDVAEFAVYDHLLEELGKQSGNMPLTSAQLAHDQEQSPSASPSVDEDALEAGAEASDQQGSVDSPKATGSRAFALDTGPPTNAPNPAAVAYVQVLDRYLGRLTAMHQLPQALAVLRKELDRNPDDPKLYERLSTFLSQNDLSAQEEEVYRAAIARFGDKSWYSKLARFYLRRKQQDAYATLTRQVTDVFAGTDLETYFGQVHGGGPQLALELNLYAHKRFPHDLLFTQNLLAAYSTKPTTDHAAWEALLRQTWWQSPDLTNEFFAFLSRTGKLQTELAALPKDSSSATNTAAMQERAEAALWASHFEAGAPLFDALAQQYPADQELGTTAADLHRSLAWVDPAGPAAHMVQAVAIEQQLLSADPGNTERLARLGDILADHADGTPGSYAASAVFWRRIPAVAPGRSEGYVQAATVFWDYFQFDAALAEIQAARTHFSDPVLYSYEAGAIYEGKRDLASALREYTAAAMAGSAAVEVPDAHATANAFGPAPEANLDPGSNPSADRLLQLARRPDTASLVDNATAAILNRTANLPALQLRVAVLDAEHRSAEAAPLLLVAVQHATSPDAEADLAALAQRRGDTAAAEAALRREASLTPDPTEALQLRYELVKAYTARQDLADAQREVDEIYRGNPRLLGVVRSTVDFDWQNHRRTQAIEVLVEASQGAKPPLAQQFAAEAASKANENGDTTRARSLAFALLQPDPYNPQYLALAAESYSRAGELAGLQQFYRARLEALRTAPMTTEQRRARTALLRKGLIPALTQAKQFPAAVDEYIALVTAYPEDATLIREAALYAARHGQKDKLLAFYRQTVQSSPRDARFFVALGATEDTFGETTPALEAYAHAVALRPERSDLFIAKALLEERLQRYDEAIADYKRLFQLSYKDPQWMVAAAKAQVRQRRPADAAKDLEAAYLHGAQSTPHDRLLIAAQLEQWGLLAEAQVYAEQGAAAAGSDLLAGDAPRVDDDDPVTLARILTRNRQTAAVFKALRSGLAEAASSPSAPGTVAAQVQSQGLASVTDAAWRQSYVRARQARAEGRFDAALQAMGEAVALYGTPEEHASFVAELKTQRGAAGRAEVAARWIPAAHAAGLGALEASWRAELLNFPGKPTASQFTAFQQLEQARLSFSELAHVAEGFVRLHPRAPDRAAAATAAADAYGTTGDIAAQLRMLQIAWTADPAAAPHPGDLRVLSERDPNALIRLASSRRQALADAATEAAVANAPPAVASQAVQARGTSLGPLWLSTYTALGGLYLQDGSPSVRAAFDRSLGADNTIGERLATATDSARQLTGKPWFYLAARYGQWLSSAPAGAIQAEDVLAADLESESSADSYLALAQTEAEAGHPDQALQEVAHALELAPDSPTALDIEATLLWQLQHKDTAITAWKTSLAALRAQEAEGPAPESYWTDFRRIAQRAQEFGILSQLRPAMSETLRSYLGHNGSYRSNELLRAAYEAAPDSAEGAAWIVSLSASAKDPNEVLQDLERASWLRSDASEAVLRREIELLQRSPHSSETNNGEAWRLPQVRSELLTIYVQAHQAADALALIQTIPAGERQTAPVQEAEIVATAQAGSLDALLRRYEAEPAIAPEADALKTAVATLLQNNNAGAARVLLEWSFARAQASHTATSADALTLAEARLRTGDSAGALAVLEALVAGSQDTDTDRDSAAALLEKNGHAADAILFLQQLVASVPWDFSYRVRLAEAQASTGAAVATELGKVASDPTAPYNLRARAARDLARAHVPAADIGSAELQLLAEGHLAPAAGRQPFFVEARAAAASASSDPAVQALLMREAIAIAPFAAQAQERRTAAFQAEAQAGSAYAAKATLMAIFQQEVTYFTDAERNEDDDPQTGDAGSTINVMLPKTVEATTPSLEAAFARQIAEAYLKTGQQETARRYLVFAREHATTATDRTKIDVEIASIAAQQRLVAANAARRPTISKQLDQFRIVRARLTTPLDVIPPATEVEHE